MSTQKLFSVFIILISAFALVFAQAEKEETVKIKQQRQDLLIEQILADNAGLKLGENRAIVYSKIGNLIWKIDPKRARTVFQNAIGELINAQTQAEAAQPKNPNNQNELLTGQVTRPQILQIIASRDAELALGFLYQSRPAIISKALAFQSLKGAKINNQNGNYQNFAQNELNMEQNFIKLAADQNPERAVNLIKDSLKKGLSSETFNLIKKLYEKDPEAAADFASQTLDKLIKTKFSPENQISYQNINLTVAILNDSIRERLPSDKSLRFDDAQVKNLADNFFSFYLDQSKSSGYYMNPQVISLAEKLAPSLVESLKKLQTNNVRSGGFFSSNYNNQNGEMTKLLSSETTAEQMVSAAGKFPANTRAQIYHAAANKFVEQDNLAAAYQLLTDNFDDDSLENAVQSLNWYYSYKLINRGKYAEAEKLIDDFPENNRISALINLAQTIYQKNPAENKAAAAAILGKVRALMSERPENAQEMSNLMQVIQAFAKIEPSEAFSLYENLIPQMNELSDAAVVLNGFQGSGNVRQGEFLLSQGGSFGFYGADYSVLQTFAKEDFDRTISLINSFTRREVRLSFKLLAAEGLAAN